MISTRSAIAVHFLGDMGRRAKSESCTYYAMDELMECTQRIASVLRATKSKNCACYAMDALVDCAKDCRRLDGDEDEVNKGDVFVSVL